MNKILPLTKQNEEYIDILGLNKRIISHMGQQFLELESDEDLEKFKALKAWKKVSR